MISPDEIPQISGDMDAVARSASSLRAAGADFADTGATVHATWQELTPVYVAPESALLLHATAPVKQVSARIGGDVESVAAALVTYAETVKPIQARLASLRALAQEFTVAAGENADWRDDEGAVDQNNRLISQVNEAVAEWMAAQRACANAINALYGGTHHVADDGDENQETGEFGYSAGQLDAAAGDDGVPWGRAEQKDGGFFSDIAHGLLDVGGLVPIVGEVADGVNALWYLAEGDELNAGLSAAGMIPFAGWGATGAKAIGKGAKAAKAARAADEVGGIVERIGPHGENIGRAATGHKKYPIREVRTEQEIDDLYRELSQGGTVVTPDSYRGEMVELADGTRIGLRDTAKTSQYPTIDIDVPNGRQIKVHVNPEGW